MSFTDFSSIFELLCGYNFVNVINDNPDSSIYRFLDFTTPISEKVATTHGRLETAIHQLIKDPEQSHDDLDRAFIYKRTSKKIGDRLIKHAKRSSNLYLIGGILGFVILLFSGISNGKMKKNNSFLILAIGVIFLYLIFLFCDFSYKKLKKIGLYIISGLLIVFCLGFISKKFNNVLGSNMRTYWIFIVLIALFIFLVIFRKKITHKKSYKALFITTFMLCCVIFNSTLWFNFYYDSQGHCYVKSLITIISILVGLLLFPFLYDIGMNLFFDWEITLVQRKLEKENFPKSPGVALTGQDMDPII